MLDNYVKVFGMNSEEFKKETLIVSGSGLHLISHKTSCVLSSLMLSHSIHVCAIKDGTVSFDS